MTASAPALPRPLRRRLRSYVERRAWQRHPVSLSRERAGRALLGLLCVSVGAYCFSTRDEGIRRRLVHYLSDTTGGEVRVGRARFDMFGGITLHDVHVSAPFDERLDRSAIDPESREIFSAKSLTLVHNPWLLLLGHLRVERIIAAQPTITLAQNVDTGLRNWQLLSAAGSDPTKSRGALAHRPIVTIRSAIATAVSVHADGGHESRNERLDVDVRPHPQVETALCIEVRRYSEPAERTTVVFDPGRRLVTNTPFVDARTVRLQVPRAVQQFFDQIALRGEAKLSRLVYDADAPKQRDSQVQLRNVKCSIPLAMLRTGPATTRPDDSPASQSAVLMTNVRGGLELQSDVLSLDVAGQVNNAECTLRGLLIGVDQPPGQIGMDVHVIAGKLPAPEAELRRQLRDDPSVPEGLRRLIADYDPRGRFDLDLKVHRPPGPGGAVGVSGVMRPVAALGRHIDFPYELSDLRGEVRFDPPYIYINKLQGLHGPAEVTISGRVNQSMEWSEIEVDIEGRNVPLDEDLFAALSEHDRAIWRKFNPTGTARINVQMRRPGNDVSSAPSEWQTHVAAELHDARLSFVDYPYPIDSVRGRIEILGHRMEVSGLSGRHGAATVQLSGRAGLDEHDPTMNLRLDARRMTIDESLMAAIPPRYRAIIEAFSLQGRVDLAGSIQRPSPADSVNYELQASLSEATAVHRDCPYSLTSLSGEILIRPDVLTLKDLKARHGDAALSASGEVRQRPDGSITDLVLNGENVRLTEELYQALPPALRTLWDMLQPAGVMRVRTALHVETGADHASWRHRSRLSAMGATIRLAPFPLTLSDLTAELEVSDRRVEILSARGRAAGSEVELRGSIEVKETGAEGVLELISKGLTIGDELLAALPERIRGKLAAASPTGRFDLRLDRLHFSTDDTGRPQWSFSGDLRLHDVGADLGFSLRRAEGLVRIAGRLTADGRTELDAALELTRADVAGWALENVRGEISKSAEANAIELREGGAGLYGGDASFSAKVAFVGERAEYDASIQIREMRLDRYLATTTTRPTDAKGRPPAKGSIYGSLVLRGQTGAAAFREGAGEVFVREAQMWKLPLLFAIFQVLNLTPDENVFHDGWLKFFLSGDVLSFEKIDLQGRAMSFVGGGSMRLPTRELDVTLLAGSPLRLRVPLLTDILEDASREIMEVRIGGTVDKPKIRPRPMRSLAALLEKVFPRPAKSRDGRGVRPAGG